MRRVAAVPLVVVLALIFVGLPGSSATAGRAQDASPVAGSDRDQEPEARLEFRDGYAEVVLGDIDSVQGARGRSLTLFRFYLEPGGRLPTDSFRGTQIWYIESGTALVVLAGVGGETRGRISPVGADERCFGVDCAPERSLQFNDQILLPAGSFFSHDGEVSFSMAVAEGSGAGEAGRLNFAGHRVIGTRACMSGC